MTVEAVPTAGRRRLVHGALLALALALAAAPLTADESIHLARARRLARDVQPALVRVQWRRQGSGAETIERHAVVIDPDGWLLLAGPRPAPSGTLAATFENGRAMRAEVWASDARTCLTLLRVPATRLPPLSLCETASTPAVEPPAEDSPGDSDPADPAEDDPGELQPGRQAPGTPFVLVTAPLRSGQAPSVARGNLRASHRHRWMDDAVTGKRVLVTCLDEAALAVLPTDLGAPWLDEDGRITGLLVGADLGSPARHPRENGVDVRPEVTAAYAVPAEVIRVVWPLLKVHRRVPRGMLGALVGRLSDAVRDQLCPGCGGYEVEDLAPNGPAQLGRVEVGDIIRAVNRRRLAPDADLSDVLLPHRPGTRIRVEVLRRGEPMELDLVLGRAD